MWWLAGLLLVAFLWVFWELTALDPHTPADTAFRGRPLLMVMVRDRAEAVEGFLRALLGLVGWRSGGYWEVMVVDAGSRDETPFIARRLLRNTGVSFSQLGREAFLAEAVLGEAYRGGTRPILLLPLMRETDPRGLLRHTAEIFAGRSRIPGLGAELHDKCSSGS